MAGVRVSATREEKSTASDSRIANSVKSRPTMPSMKAMGTNTITSTAVVATTAKPTSRVPCQAAIRGDSPRCRWWWMFSTTTMASSTTRPMARMSASRVMRLMEKPRYQAPMKAEMSDTGTVMAGIRVVRACPRKR
ncbi:hypothetical protein D3C80_621720 [compost metagenome]